MANILQSLNKTITAGVVLTIVLLGIMVSAYNKSGSQTIDHYSLLGFTKAYNSAKKNCS